MITEEEVLKFREETRGPIEKIHFNNAGSSLNPTIVVDTVVNYLREEAIIGGYEAYFKYKPTLEYTYDLIAKLINSERDEIEILENASTAWGSLSMALDSMRAMRSSLLKWNTLRI